MHQSEVKLQGENMKQSAKNCPSSNNWVKFEDSEQVGETSTSNSCSPSPRDENEIKVSFSGSKSAVILQPVKTQAKEHKTYPDYSHTHSRYSAFDPLRFGVSKTSQIGWSSHLLGEEGKVDTRSRTYQGSRRRTSLYIKN